jgi:flagellar protein FlbD
MITLTRLTGAPFALNPDLVERVDCTPDTVITLVDGTKYLVSESLQEVSDTILGYRASIIALAGAYTASDEAASAATDLTDRRRSRLSSVPSGPDPVQDVDHVDHVDHADHADHVATAQHPVTREPRRS